MRENEIAAAAGHVDEKQEEPIEGMIAVDLFCGKGGWTRGLQAAGWRVVGFDIAADLTRDYPGELVLQDVATIDGTRWRGKVGLIVASPPCQGYSYRAMPWKRAKALPPPDNSLFEACFRIAREAECPIVVENVRGAQKWVGRAVTHFGSYYLWGDVPALIPIPRKATKGTKPVPNRGWTQGCAITLGLESYNGQKVPGMNFHEHEKTGEPGRSFQSAAVAECGIKQGGSGAAWWDKALDERRKEAARSLREGVKGGGDWFGSGSDCSLQRRHGSRSNARREASALIAMIPFDLAKWIGEVYHPDNNTNS